MQKVLDILAKTLSIVLYPLLIPTYGMGLFFAAMHVHSPEMPATLAWLSVVGTLFLTCVIPVTLIIWMWRRGQLTSLYIEDPKQRTTPYIYCTVCYAFWCYFVRATMHLPLMWLLLAIGATLALAMVTIINRRWKISAHLSAMGGLLGGVCSYGLCGGVDVTAAVVAVLVVSLLLMYARIYLKAHTPMQVVCGYLLGLVFTFVPNLIMMYA